MLTGRSLRHGQRRPKHLEHPEQPAKGHSNRASEWGHPAPREILGIQLGDSESEGSWAAFFTWLKRRGLAGVDVVVSDVHTGLVAAVQRHFQGCTWQRCQTHLAGDVLEAAPKGLRQELHAYLRTLFEASDLPTARVLLQQVMQMYASRAPKAMATLETGFDDATAVLALPEPYRRRLCISHGVERLNEEVHRRERVIRIFPNRESTIRLLGAVLMERHEQWSTGHRYVDIWTWAAIGTDEAHGHSRLRRKPVPLRQRKQPKGVRVRARPRRYTVEAEGGSVWERGALACGKMTLQPT
jgi:putative transposase